MHLYWKYLLLIRRNSYLISVLHNTLGQLQLLMNLPPLEHLPNAISGQLILRINHQIVIFLQANCSIHDVVTLHILRPNLFRPKSSSVDSRTNTFPKPILAPISVSKYDSTPSPTAISVPVGVYNLGRLCIQLCQNRDDTAAVGLCTCTA